MCNEELYILNFLENTSIRKKAVDGDLTLRLDNLLIGPSLREKNPTRFGCWLEVALSAFVVTIHLEWLLHFAYKL